VLKFLSGLFIGIIYGVIYAVEVPDGIIAKCAAIIKLFF
jgi:small basic protein